MTQDMTKPYTGGPAFPQANDGMTLRDYFAAQALAGMLANCDEAGINAWTEIETHAASTAYQFADAMLEARDQ